MWLDGVVELYLEVNFRRVQKSMFFSDYFSLLRDIDHSKLVIDYYWYFWENDNAWSYSENLSYYFFFLAINYLLKFTIAMVIFIVARSKLYFSNVK